MDELRWLWLPICNPCRPDPGRLRPQLKSNPRHQRHADLRYVRSGVLTTPRRNWKRIGAWIVGGQLVLIAFSVIGVLALLHNSAFRQYLLRVALAKINEAVGTELKISNFSVRLSGFSPTLDLYDVVIGGAAPYQKTPFLKVNHLSVGIQVVSLMQRKWYFKHIVIDHPVAQVLVGENGDSNLPKLINQTRNVFDIGVRHVTLNQGELYYNDERSALDLDLHNLDLHSTFDPIPKRYSDALSYADGKIHFQNFNPMVHSLQAEFDATADTFELKHGLITSGASQLSLIATLQDYAHPKITGTYQSSLDTKHLRYVLKDTTLPVGIVKLAGSVKFESDPDKPILETLTLDGNMSSPGIQIHTAAIHTLVRSVSAQYLLKSGDIEVRNIRAALLGGGMNGSFKLHDITGTQVSELHATLHDVALAGIQALVNAQALRDFRLTGTTNATVDANWRKAFKNFTAHADATAVGTLYERPGASRSASAITRSVKNRPALQSGVPITAEIHAGYLAASQTVSFTRSYIQTPQTTINLD